MCICCVYRVSPTACCQLLSFSAGCTWDPAAAAAAAADWAVAAAGAAVYRRLQLVLVLRQLALFYHKPQWFV
jgi:hypothetical protein